jgi:hypothetical protein
METKYLDKEIELRELLDKDGSLSPSSKEALIEFKAIKEQLELIRISHQRKLLLFFLSKINKDAIDLFNEGKGEIVIDHFLKNNSELLPKQLCNEAYKCARTMDYDGFVTWWDKQV